MINDWPDEYADLLDSVISAWTVQKLDILRQFTSGFTRAKVYEVDIDSEVHHGIAILKLDQNNVASTSGMDEPLRFAKARERSPAFAASHLPQLLATNREGPKIALLSSIAGDSLLHSQTLSRMDTAQQETVVDLVSQDLLTEWNSGATVCTGVSPQQFVAEMVGHRIREEQGGTVPQLLKDEWGVAREAAFSFDGEWLPNPLTFGLDPAIWKRDGHGHGFLQGNVHGDLHSKNLIIRHLGPEEYGYYLIDLSMYNDQSFIMYDHAYLEMSLLLDHRGNADYRRWMKIMSIVSDGDPAYFEHKKGELDDVGLLKLVKKIRQQSAAWAHEHHRSRRDHLEAQGILARVAAGLNFAHKPMDVRKRSLAMLYSAFHLRQYLRIVEMEWVKIGPSVELTDPSQISKSEDWRLVWHGCGQFNRHESAYVLVAGKGLRDVERDAQGVLGRIPWSVVVDFDTDSGRDGLLAAARTTLETHRKVRETLLDEAPDVNFREATSWLMAGGTSDRPTTIEPDQMSWQWTYGPFVRSVLHDLRKAIAPQPITCLVIPDGAPDLYIQTVLRSLGEVFRDDSRVVALGNEHGLEYLRSSARDVTVVDCSLPDLLGGLWQMYGHVEAHQGVQLPGRDLVSGQRKTVFLSTFDAQYLKEDLEIVHAGLVEQMAEGRAVGDDFWHGYEVTWTDLDMGADVARDATIALEEHILEHLGRARTVTIPLYHTPGSGGTTVAKRIAWNLKDRYPTVRLTHVSTATVARIEELTTKTNLPVLVILDGIEQAPRDQIFRGLVEAKKNAVLLWIRRSMLPRLVEREHERASGTASDHESRFSVEDPLTRSEARRFLDRYSQYAPAERLPALRDLAETEEMLPYRSPFFFGLTAFEKDFVRIPEYVSDHLRDVTAAGLMGMHYLALVTRYTNLGLSDIELGKVLDLSAPTRSLRVEGIFGYAASRILVRRNDEWRINHPLIAEEILRQGLRTSPDALDADWKNNLVELSVSFIKKMVQVLGPDSDRTLSLFSAMFISRDPWTEDKDRKRQFSYLLMSIESQEGQNKILVELTNACPREPHFWNHLGRHHIYVMKSQYEVAEACLAKAIEIDSDNEVHHHSLGMVYRFEVRRILTSERRKGGSPDNALKQIEGLVAKADQCFDRARNLDFETEYGYVTNIQLIVECIEGLYSMSKKLKYAEFFGTNTRSADWSRDKLAFAEELSRRLELVQAEGGATRLAREYRLSMRKFYDDYEVMITGFSELLKSVTYGRASIRRTVVGAYLARGERRWSQMNREDLRNIVALMENNLDEDPTNARDLWTWFHAYRRLPEFEILEALDRLKRWTIRENVIEAHYYLYILYFVRTYRGLGHDAERVKYHLEQCRKLAGSLQRVRSFEWLATSPPWCPVVHQNDLGDWDRSLNFYAHTDALAWVDGTILTIKDRLAGTLHISPSFNVFFVPGEEFRRERDEHVRVKFSLGFSYEGLRAWRVQRS